MVPGVGPRASGLRHRAGRRRACARTAVETECVCSCHGGEGDGAGDRGREAGLSLSRGPMETGAPVRPRMGHRALCVSRGTVLRTGLRLESIDTSGVTARAR